LVAEILPPTARVSDAPRHSLTSKSGERVDDSYIASACPPTGRGGSLPLPVPAPVFGDNSVRLLCRCDHSISGVGRTPFAGTRHIFIMKNIAGRRRLTGLQASKFHVENLKPCQLAEQVAPLPVIVGSGKSAKIFEKPMSSRPGMMGSVRFSQSTVRKLP